MIFTGGMPLVMDVDRPFCVALVVEGLSVPLFLGSIVAPDPAPG